MRMIESLLKTKTTIWAFKIRITVMQMSRDLKDFLKRNPKVETTYYTIETHLEATKYIINRM